MKKYHVNDANKMVSNLSECSNISEATYLYFGSVLEAKKYFEYKEKIEYLAKIGLSRLGYLATRKITHFEVFYGPDPNPIELKNFYHTMIFQFGWKGAELIKYQGFFGRAYYNALLSCNNGNSNCCIPSAKMIFAELKKLLTRATYHGFEIEESVKKYM